MLALTATRTLLLLAATSLALGCGAGPSDPEAATSDDELAARATSVEIKVSIDPREIAGALAALDLAPRDAEERDVWFYDTPRLDYFEAGLILRARKVKDGQDDSTIKRRPMTAKAAGRGWLALSGFKCEEDRSGSRSVESCSLTTTQDRGEIDAVARGERGVAKLFSSDQERFAAWDGDTPAWSSLKPLGPIAARVWRVEPRGLRATLTVELWTLPDGTTLLEVSTKTTRADADRVGADLVAYLEGLGLRSASAQETKTRAALERLAGR